MLYGPELLAMLTARAKRVVVPSVRLKGSWMLNEPLIVDAVVEASGPTTWPLITA